MIKWYFELLQGSDIKLQLLNRIRNILKVRHYLFRSLLSVFLLGRVVFNWFAVEAQNLCNKPTLTLFTVAFSHILTGHGSWTGSCVPKLSLSPSQNQPIDCTWEKELQFWIATRFLWLFRKPTDPKEADTGGIVKAVHSASTLVKPRPVTACDSIVLIKILMIERCHMIGFPIK